MKKYFDEIFPNVNGKKEKREKIEILVCVFATPRSRWENIYLDIEKKIELFLIKNNFINFRIKMAMIDNFEKQVKRASVIFISGGDDELLQWRLQKFNINEIFNNKIVACESSSVNLVVDSFWACDWRKNMNGLGILPIKFIAHYRSKYGESDSRGLIDWKKAKESLAKFGNKKLAVYALEEGDFVVFEK